MQELRVGALHHSWQRGGASRAGLHSRGRARRIARCFALTLAQANVHAHTHARARMCVWVGVGSRCFAISLAEANATLSTRITW